MSFMRFVRLFLVFLAGVYLLTFSNIQSGDQLEKIRAFTRRLEFDYVSWTLSAAGVKISQLALQANRQITPQAQRQIVLDYLALVERIKRAEAHLNDIYANPDVRNPQSASALVRAQLTELRRQRELLGPLAESILQEQISTVIADLGLSMGGQPLPPVLYRTTPLPTALIVSPREVIRQDYHISLTPDLSTDLRAHLEEQVDQSLNVSSLVVDIGGMGVYPTMVIETSDLNYLTEVVAHEWIHNYLTLRPLGLNYTASPELRTMNETTASIAGIEIGRAVMERYYPDLLPPEQTAETQPPVEEDETPEPPVFDFRNEMRLTRLTVDALLAAGKVRQAEEYMEIRRQFLWENGYHIRKLNQAYFAFYGAYAEQPGGAAGEDPVGEAVRVLRAKSPSLAAFIKRIAWMSSFEQLKRAVDADTP